MQYFWSVCLFACSAVYFNLPPRPTNTLVFLWLVLVCSELSVALATNAKKHSGAVTQIFPESGECVCVCVCTYLYAHVSLWVAPRGCWSTQEPIALTLLAVPCRCVSPFTSVALVAYLPSALQPRLASLPVLPAGNMAQVLPEYLCNWTTEKVRSSGVEVRTSRKVVGAKLNGRQHTHTRRQKTSTRGDALPTPARMQDQRKSVRSQRQRRVN